MTTREWNSPDEGHRDEAVDGAQEDHQDGYDRSTSQQDRREDIVHQPDKQAPYEEDDSLRGTRGGKDINHGWDKRGNDTNHHSPATMLRAGAHTPSVPRFFARPTRVNLRPDVRCDCNGVGDG